MIYLATPYSDPDKAVEHNRYLAALKIAAELISMSRWVHSPIVHCHEMSKLHQLPTTADFWRNYNHHMIERSGQVYIALIDGWQNSKGCYGEIEYAHISGKGVYVLQITPENSITKIANVDSAKLLDSFSPLAKR